MSKVKLTVGKNAPCKKHYSDIPKGTYFTGRIGGNQERAFFRGYDTIVGLEMGDTWSFGEVTDYVVCDVEINLKPVR